MSTALDPQVGALLRQAAEWRMLGLLFDCPSEEWRRQVAALASELEDIPLREAAEQALSEAAEGDYHSIFGPGGPAPAREVSYHETIQLGYLISEVTSFYQAFAYQPVTVEALDHIAVEAGFIGFLRLKEAFAVLNAETEHALTVAEVAKRFLEDHLAYMAQPLAASLKQSGVGYLAGAGAALLKQVGPPRTLPVIQPLPTEPACLDSTFDCGI